jgi:SecD/SecF fusion protein
MRNKGAIWTLAIALTLVCLYQLSFTVVTYKVRKDSRDYARDANNVVDLKKADYYLDSVASSPVYNFLWMKKYTYRECQDREINLGLDLQGGMNVILEVSVVDVIRSMANYTKDSTFNRAIALAKRNQVGSNENFVNLFGQAFEQIDPNARLSALFTSPELRERITYNTSNQEVLKVIREEADKAIANSFNIINTRINHFGVNSPNVQRLQSGDRILVELPGVQEKDRVRKLLQGAARLEFWETYNNTDAEIRNGLLALNNLVKEINKSQKAAVPAVPEAAATAATGTGTTVSKQQATDEEAPALLQQLAQDSTKASGDTAASSPDAFMQDNPLFAFLIPYVNQNGELIPGSVFGQVHYKDTAKVNQYLKLAMDRNLFPRNFKYFWSAMPIVNPTTKKATDYYEVHAIKVTSRDGRAPLTGDVITRAQNQYNQNSGQAYVSMDMDAAGTQTWARLTRENVGKIITVVMDDYVYSNPVVNEEIPTGSSQISGSFDAKEAEDLANLLKSGTMPAPCKIIQEEIIGPSLGKESIRTGMNSLIISFILIFSFMVFYYTRRAGLVADIALFLNMFFLIGVLASLGLALTLPGIAGIVLNIGMSVDANVLINERIREELMAGKGVKMAIQDGYKNALSAIIDGNLTTLITGVILFVLGTGPVKGFATTLVIGIITTLFSTIFISRLVFELWLDRNPNALTFSTRLSTGAFKNINLDYINNRKKFYVMSAVIFVVGVGSLIFRGLDQGVDFTGGRNYIIKFEKPVSNLEIAGLLEKELGMRPTVITYGSEDKVRITTKYAIDSEDPNIDEQVEQLIYNGVKPMIGSNVTYAQFKADYVQGLQRVGPTIAADIKRKSYIALFIALFCMFLYVGFRFRNWSFGLGAIASLAHDAFLVIALFSLLYGIMPFSLEADQTFIAAILTIIGYSVNDTVVIFDRIREYRILHPKMDYAMLMNKAINDTFSRTIITSLTVLITVAIIFFYTGESVRGFAFALLIGLISGVYSTVFIATALVYDSRGKKERTLQAK